MAGRLKWIRKELGWSQRQLGEAIGGDKHTIKRIETGTDISLDKAKRICRALRIDLQWLAYGAPKQTYSVSTFGLEIALYMLERIQEYRLPTLHREADIFWSEAKERFFESGVPGDAMTHALYQAKLARERAAKEG